MIDSIRKRIDQTAISVNRRPEEIKLVVVSKKQSIDAILELYRLGIRDFGESRVQEAKEKQLALPQDISWHLIGSLQSNKVRKAVGSYSLIHSVDSLELAQKIDLVSAELGVVTQVLLEVNTSNEFSKHGMTIENIEQNFSIFLAFKNLRVCGLMTMAPEYKQFNLEEEKLTRSYFASLKALQGKFCRLYPTIQNQFKELSMGMSQDFEIAIQEGATIVRIGSAIFSMP